MLYPQNGDRFVAIDSVTSLHPVYKQSSDAPIQTRNEQHFKCLANVAAASEVCIGRSALRVPVVDEYGLAHLEHGRS